MFLDYENFNESYYSKNHNLFKIANSETPITGKPVFTDTENQSFFTVRRKMMDNLSSYDEHMKTAEEKMGKYIEDAKTKGEREHLLKANNTRGKAYDIVQRAAAFMEKFNELYDSLKEDLMSEDHIKVAQAILKLREIRPHKLIEEAGTLKRIRLIKLDSYFVKSVLGWVDSISRIYDTFEEAGKLLGKTDKQIEGARKQAASQRMRWGMY
jgi:hypothetical protein